MSSWRIPSRLEIKGTGSPAVNGTDSVLFDPAAASLEDVAPMNAGDAFTDGAAPGNLAPDAPVERDGSPGTLLDCLGPGMALLYFANPDGSLSGGDGDVLLALADFGVRPVVVLPPYCPFVGDAASGRVLDQSGIVHERYDARPSTGYLIDPGRRILGRWRRLNLAAIRSVIRS